MDEGKLFGRSNAFPPRIGPDGRLTWSEGPANIRESIRIILLTELEERVMLPKFGGGLRSFLFQPNTPSTHRLIEARTERALKRWEPRIRVESIVVEPDPDEVQGAFVHVAYRLVALDLRDQVSLAVQLASPQ